MVRYLKYIVVIFGSIGIVIGSFFYYQNRVDIHTALEYRSKIDSDFLIQNCNKMISNNFFPCLVDVFEDYLSQVSLTGTNFGMKMVFNVMDDLKNLQSQFKDEAMRKNYFAMYYLILNNMANKNAYQRYFGAEMLYGGFVASLDKFYSRSNEFSENIIFGLESNEGIETITDIEQRDKAMKKFLSIKKNFYKIKDDVQTFIENVKQKHVEGV